MPVNMDPNKRRRKPKDAPEASTDSTADSPKSVGPNEFGQESETDRQKALAEAELKNLWDATEVIDMDKW